MPRIRRMELVGEGVQRNGQEVTKDILDSVVRNYNPNSRPPITLGHPKKGDDQMAAMGRVGHLRTERNEKGVYVLAGEMIYTPELAQLEDDGKFEGQSVGIYPVNGKPGEYYMHHLAQLGSLPPAGDIKTKDVVNLSDGDFNDDAIYLTANTPNESEEKMKITINDIVSAVKDCSAEEKKQLGTVLGFEAPTDDKSQGKPNGTGEDNTQDNKTELKNDAGGGGSKDVKAMQESMAADRRERLTELADTQNIGEKMKEVITGMIKSASAVELCDRGEDSTFNTIKSLILSAAPAPGSNGYLLESLELSDDGTEKKDVFDSSAW